jgi:hypothetical protein
MRARFAPKAEKTTPDVAVTHPTVDSYDDLLPATRAAAAAAAAAAANAAMNAGAAP